jgi:phage gp29-like protein
VDVQAAAIGAAGKPAANIGRSEAPPPDPVLERRQVGGETSEFYIFQPELSPMQVRGLLYSAMQGNFYAAYDLFSVMQDTSPRLLINLHQMREMASRAKLKVHPFRVGDRKPTMRAVERALEIDWMLKQWRPDPNADELGISGLVYEVLGAMVQPTMCELQYHLVDNRWCPRAATWIIPRKYVFDRDSGRLGVGSIPDLDWTRENASLQTTPGKVTLLHPIKHVLSVYKSRSAAMTLSGLVRPLPYWWSAAMFGRKWLLDQAQRFGIPFTHITYPRGTPESAIQELRRMANTFAANGNAVTLDTMAIKFIEQHFDPRENPNNWLIEKFDYYCDLVILRETRPSDIGRSSTSYRGGSAQAGEMRASQTETVEALTAFSDGVLTAQLVRNLCLLNYGDEQDMPHIETSFAQPESPKDDAETLSYLNQAGLSADAEEQSERFGFKLSPARNTPCSDSSGRV